MVENQFDQHPAQSKQTNLNEAGKTHSTHRNCLFTFALY